MMPMSTTQVFHCIIYIRVVIIDDTIAAVVQIGIDR